MNPYFHRFSSGATCPWRLSRRVLIPIFLSHVELIFRDENLETHNPIEQTPFIKQLILSHNFSSTFCLAVRQAQRIGIGIFATYCCQYNNYMTGWNTFSEGNIGTESFFLFPEGLAPLLPELFEGIFPTVCAYACGAREDDRPSRPWPPVVPDARSRRNMRLRSKIVQLLSTESILPPSFPRWLLSFFWTLGYRSSHHNFVTDSEVSHPHRLITLKSYRCLQS